MEYNIIFVKKYIDNAIVQSSFRPFINDFINECFNSSGKIKEADYPKSPSKWNCNFCP